MANILIAAGTDGSARMRAILESRHKLAFAKTTAEALDALGGCDLVVCGLEFDESRMFDFLRMLNDDKKLRATPRVCVRFLATDTPERVLEGLEMAARAAGAHGFLDLPTLDEQLGRSGADDKVRQEIESTINGDS